MEREIRTLRPNVVVVPGRDPKVVALHFKLLVSLIAVRAEVLFQVLLICSDSQAPPEIGCVCLSQHLVVNASRRLRDDHPTQAVLPGLPQMPLDQPANAVIIPPGVLGYPPL